MNKWRFSNKAVIYASQRLIIPKFANNRSISRCITGGNSGISGTTGGCVSTVGLDNSYHNEKTKAVPAIATKIGIATEAPVAAVGIRANADPETGSTKWGLLV